VVPIRRLVELVVVVAGCLPPDAPPPPKPPGPDPEVTALVHAWTVAAHVLADGAMLTEGEAVEMHVVHAWTVAAHVLADGAMLTEGEAVEMHGRTIDVRADGYTTPWHGTCEDAGRTHRTRDLAAVVEDLRIPAASRRHLVSFGLDGELGEYHLKCNGTVRTPPLTLYVAGPRAMTCFSGVCYLMKR
jgi:hypothetical protein